MFLCSVELVSVLFSVDEYGGFVWGFLLFVVIDSTWVYVSV
jgi:hypothetical protein